MTTRTEIESQQSVPELRRPPTYEGNSLRFEGVSIQLDKGRWDFESDVETHSLDTYSIWSPTHHEEIAERLKNGERAATYMMGNFGVVEMRRPEMDNKVMFTDIKQRPEGQNFVGFVSPNDLIEIIDVDRLPPELKSLRWAGNRHGIYPDGPMHAVFPIKQGAEVDPGIIRKADNTLSAFWIPGHWGYEKLGDRLRKKVKRGILGGGSLNITGEEPSYTKKELYNAFLRNPVWQKALHFIVFDEIAERANIGRSQSMVSFAEYPPKMLRMGSLSAGAIEMNTGMPVRLDPDRLGVDPKYYASSKTRYTPHQNELADRKMEDLMAQIGRFKEFSNARMRSEERAPWFQRRGAGHTA